MAKTVIGFFRARSDAENALETLVHEGYNRSEINLVAGDPATMAATPKIGPVHSVGAETEAGRDAVVGAMAGLAIGMVSAVLPGIGAILAIGPIAGAIGGLGLGAGIGGAVGLIRDMGVSEEESEYYMEGVRRGGAVVALSCSDDNADRAEKTLKKLGAVDIKEEAEGWRTSGWTSTERPV